MAAVQTDRVVLTTNAKRNRQATAHRARSLGRSAMCLDHHASETRRPGDPETQRPQTPSLSHTLEPPTLERKASGARPESVLPRTPRCHQDLKPPKPSAATPSQRDHTPHGPCSV